MWASTPAAWMTDAIGRTTMAERRPLRAAGQHFGKSDEPDGARRLDPVLNFAGEPELLRQRHGDGLNALEHDGESDHPRHENGGKGRFGPGDARSADALSDFGKHIEKDEAEEERLHQGADSELDQVLAQAPTGRAGSGRRSDVQLAAVAERVGSGGHSA